MYQFFVNQKYHETNGNWTNNCHVKTGDTPEQALMNAKHQFHAFMSTYAYGQTPGNPQKDIDYASCSIESIDGMIIVSETDNRIKEESKEEEPVEETKSSKSEKDDDGFNPKEFTL